MRDNRGHVDFASVAPAMPDSRVSGLVRVTASPTSSTGSEKIEAATKDLLKQLNAGHTEEFKQVLAFFGKLWQYSVFNCYLIHKVKPDAEAVAGYAAWKKLGRQVSRGAVGAQIFVPIFGKQEDNGEKKLRGFTMGRVFSDKDLTDIEENPLPSPWTILPDDATELYDQLAEKVGRATGYDIHEVSMFYNSALGSCDHGRKVISIVSSLSSQRKAMVLLHEAVHGLFHGTRALGVSRARKEFEAEATAFVLASVLGLTNPNSSDYVLHWAGSGEDLKGALGIIQSMSREAIQKLELTV